jgi:hypothetical protein
MSFYYVVLLQSYKRVALPQTILQIFISIHSQFIKNLLTIVLKINNYHNLRLKNFIVSAIFILFSTISIHKP